jgi:hypothetical protein
MSGIVTPNDFRVHAFQLPGFPLSERVEDKLRGNDDCTRTPVIPAGIQINQGLKA